MLAYVVMVCLGVLLGVLAIGFLLPGRVVVERAVVIEGPAEKIFPWVADLRRWPEWTVWNRDEDPTLAYTYPPSTTGLGGSMSWTARKMGDGSLIISAFEANRALGYELRLPAHGTIVSGSIEFESAGAGATRVVWLDEVDLGRNPFKKLLGPVLKRMLGRSFARNLAGLRRAVTDGRASGPGPK